jgi:glutamate racemase
MNILVIDLGLGGLDILSRLYEYLLCIPDIGECKLIFYQINRNSININDKYSISSKIALICNLYLCDILVIGCHSIAVTIKGMRSNNGLQIINIAEVTKNYIINSKLYGKEIALFASPNTHRSGYYNHLNSNKVTVIPCVDLARKIETGNKKEIKIGVEQCIDKISSKPSLAILACTHYSIIEQFFCESLKNKFNREIPIVNPNNLIVENIGIKYSKGTTKIKMILDLCYNSEMFDKIKEKFDSIDNIQIKNHYLT